VTFRVTLIGLGLIGSSIGLGLKQAKADMEIIGHDKDGETAKRAVKNDCVDRTDWNLINACDGADLVVLCIPLAAVQDTLKVIAHELKPGCVITDTASLKVPVLQWARDLLPDTVHFVGGHPVLRHPGTEPLESDANLLAGAVYCLTPGSTTPPEATQSVSDLAEAMGASPYYIDAAEHDGLIAAVEQLPLLLSLALQVMAGTSPSQRELIQLSGSDFLRMTNGLAGDAQSLSNSCISNAANLTRWLDSLQAELARLRQFVDSGDADSLQKLMGASQAMRDQWMCADRQTADKAVNYDDFSMTHMITGDLFKQRKPKGK